MHVNWCDCLGLYSSVQRSWKELYWFHVHLFDVVFIPEPRLHLFKGWKRQTTVANVAKTMLERPRLDLEGRRGRSYTCRRS